MSAPYRAIMSRRVAVPLLLASVVLASASSTSAAAPRAVSLTVAPRAGSASVVQLTARAPSSARTVTFHGRWTGADGVRRTAQVGSDRVRSNGWSVGWNARDVPAGRTVTLTAKAFDGRGRTIGVSAGRTWRAPTSGKSKGSGAGSTGPTVAGTVDGTCAESTACVVAVRDAPSTRGTRVGELREGRRVAVRCRIEGQLVTTTAGSSSTWLQVDAGRWVSALYVVTPATAVVPACAG